jgi:hypothetical protein
MRIEIEARNLSNRAVSAIGRFGEVSKLAVTADPQSSEKSSLRIHAENGKEVLGSHLPASLRHVTDLFRSEKPEQRCALSSLKLL